MKYKLSEDIGSSLTAVRRQSFGMEAHIHEKRSEFCPPGLKDYLDSRDEAGTSEAAKKVMEIHSKLSIHVINTLKQHYGTENKAWWTARYSIEDSAGVHNKMGRK